jgi:hypothetical protein
LNFCQSPVTRRIAATDSVGCAPTPSQYWIRSESTLIGRRLVLGVVLPHRLDRPAVPLGAGVGDDDAVVRLAHLADTHELDLRGHGCGNSSYSDGRAIGAASGVSRDARLRGARPPG